MNCSSPELWTRQSGARCRPPFCGAVFFIDLISGLKLVDCQLEAGGHGGRVTELPFYSPMAFAIGGATYRYCSRLYTISLHTHSL
jgi:hypothetical protein